MQIQATIRSALWRLRKKPGGNDFDKTLALPNQRCYRNDV